MKYFNDQSFNEWLDDACSSCGHKGSETHILDVYSAILILAIGIAIGAWLF